MEYSDIAPILGLLWSPIAAVSSHWEGQDNAQICVSIGGASIVPERPRVLVQIYKTNHSHEMITKSGAFALNFPRAGQLDWIPAFGMRSGREEEKLSGVEHSAGRTGSPLIADCWGWLDCVVVNAMDGGDMTCFLVEVLEGNIVSDEGPLWWRDARRRLPAEWMEEWDRKITAEIEVSTERMDQIDYSAWTPGEKRQA
jgi:flavin reductase (DIM6/NTAB) family NADH-FMN oxidoreductase RutF